MSDVILFHGSNIVVENPKILENGYYKDFGYGFYCTQFEKIVFCTKKALDIIKFDRSYSV